MGSIFVDLNFNKLNMSQNIASEKGEAFGTISIAQSDKILGNFTLEGGIAYIIGREVELKNNSRSSSKI